jgi:hypothetical protein
MKKISLVALASMVAASVMAQNTTQEGVKDFKPLRTPMATKIRFGITGGVNLSKFSISDNNPSGFSTTMKAGPFGGAFVNIPLGSILRIQPGVTYNLYGSKISNSGIAYQENLHYVSVPVAIQVVPGNSGFFFEVGPQANFLVAAKFHDQTSGSTSQPDRSNKGDFDNFDFSAFGGVGYITRIGLGFEGKYNAGFNNVLGDNAAGSGLKWKNRSWTFGIFYHFGAAK